MHNINNTNNAQFDDKNPPASPKVFAFVFFAENRYICTVMQGDTATAQAKRAGGRKTVQNDGRRCGDRNRKPLQFVDIHRAYIRTEAPLSAQSNFQKDGFFEFILFYFYIRLTNKRIKRSPYSFPGSAISVFLLCKIPSERANLIFFQHKLTSETPSYLHYDKTIPTKTTLFFGNPYATNLF
ncbi:hypothetical protein [Alistipes putredinis]|uniref:hypothetical protein n=1 Tax=Alistipes putredinis TaxID=28117 RepID=UPI003AB68467